MLENGSSSVDWCEDNYSISPFIAEFVNTVSNALFLLLPPLLIWLFVPYGRLYNKGVHIIWLMLMVVGVCSAYYHATLSLLGQLLDELAILWVVAAAFAIWYPTRYLPPCLRNIKRIVLQMFICGLAVLISALALVQPAINAFALMTLGLPALWLLVSELWKCKNSRALRLGVCSGVIWVLAMACWVSDKFFCETWTVLNFPYFHAFWHIFIFLASYTGCVLFAYFDALYNVPDLEPELKFWPKENCEFLGVPYVALSRPFIYSVEYVDETQAAADLIFVDF